MKIVVADASLLPHREAFQAALPPGCTVSWHLAKDKDLPTALAEAEVFVGSALDRASGQAAPHLRLVHAAGAGVDSIDRAGLQPSTVVANTFHHEDSIAEQVTAASVILRRNLLVQDQQLRQGVWASSVHDPEIPQSSNLRGARIGLVAFGHIGRRCWQLFQAFGCTGCAVTRSDSIEASHENLEWSGPVDSDLDRLLEESDVVVVSAPLNDETRDLIGAAELGRMKSDAVIINVGRGPIINEDALFDALSSKQIGGAAIDVWYQYPSDGQGAPGTQPFHTLPNVLLTPHSSGVTRQTFAARVADITANITRLANGTPLLNVVPRPEESS